MDRIQKIKKILKCPIVTMIAMILSAEIALLTISISALAAEYDETATLVQSEEIELPEPEPEPEPEVVIDPEQPKEIPIEQNSFWDKQPGENWQTYYTEQDVLDCAWVLWFEYRACESFTEKSKVVWTICNRVDDPRWPNDFRSVVSAPHQFAWCGMPDTERMNEDVITVARDVLERWNAEKNGMENVGRTLPKDSIGFWGDGKRNHFYAQTYPGPRVYYEFSPEEGPYDN